MNAFEYTVTQQDDGTFSVMTPYRSVMWIGETEREAIGCAMRGLCELVRDGHLDPGDPHAPGKNISVPPGDVAPVAT